MPPPPPPNEVSPARSITRHHRCWRKSERRPKFACCPSLASDEHCLHLVASTCRPACPRTISASYAGTTTTRSWGWATARPTGRGAPQSLPQARRQVPRNCSHLQHAHSLTAFARRQVPPRQAKGRGVLRNSHRKVQACYSRVQGVAPPAEAAGLLPYAPSLQPYDFQVMLDPEKRQAYNEVISLLWEIAEDSQRTALRVAPPFHSSFRDPGVDWFSILYTCGGLQAAVKRETARRTVASGVGHRRPRPARKYLAITITPLWRGR